MIMKRSNTRRVRDSDRRILDALRDGDGRCAKNPQEAISRFKFLAEQGRRVLEKVSTRAHEALLSDQSLRVHFLDPKAAHTAFVMSIDIRRSTELMLKARTAELFAEFMAELCEELQRVICDRFGVVDKFTGDGLLAAFPEFFSGADAGYRALSAAQEAHVVFVKRYKLHRSSFFTVLRDIGLGIGIDYGNIRFLRIAGDLTVVGTPVVYATRLSCGPPGKTLLNQPAYEKVVGPFGAFCSISETDVDIKHEGRVLAYDVRLKRHSFRPTDPPWIMKKKDK